MTIEATTRRRSTRAARREEREELAIGETDANIFNCPACARPLDVGTTRCPGCQTRLIAGVKATRAIGFLGIGALVGVMAGSLITGTSAMLVVALSPTTAAAGPTTPDGRPVASQAVPGAPVAPGSALTALRQTALVNQRLLEDAGRLDAALSVKRPSSVDIARILRSIASDAAFGDRLAPDVGAWDAAAPLSSDLVSFYAQVGATARDGLAASITNERRYVDAGSEMRTLLGRVADLDERASALVTSATP